jgi:tRNA dimethylallyltransferase
MSASARLPAGGEQAASAFVKGLFFVAGPTASGKSEVAADVARCLGAEIVNADAFQIYRGLDLLTAKPDASMLEKAPHHLIGRFSLQVEMNVERFRRVALRAIEEIRSRGKPAIVVGGSGLYIKTLTHGLAAVPAGDPAVRRELDLLDMDRLRAKIVELDPEGAGKIDMNNRRRLVRAIEICLLAGRPASAQRTQWAVDGALRAARGAAVSDDCHRQGVPQSETATAAGAAQRETSFAGVFVFRDRDELYARIHRRVEMMFEKGVIEEVQAAEAVGETASKMIGLREIRDLLDGRMSIPQCMAEIQQATRRYAKRQLTWFRRQTNFKQLNLSHLTHNEAVKCISQAARMSRVVQRDD